MNINFFIPTEEEWYGTYEGGYVEVVISNESYPEKNTIRIVFEGNDDFMMTWGKDIDPKNEKDEFFDAIKMVASIPVPIKKDDLEKLGFAVE